MKARRQVVAQYVPMVAGALMMSATTVVDRAMAASLPAGSVASLGYGERFVAREASVGYGRRGHPGHGRAVGGEKREAEPIHLGGQ